MITKAQRIQGCLLGSAVGDALGAPVEFMAVDQINKQYGPNGILEFDVAYGRRGAITDDTQMTMFTAEGLLKSETDDPNKVMKNVHDSYRTWYFTQTLTMLPNPTWFAKLVMLAENPRRAPGSTCLTALSIHAELPNLAANDSFGCGGVMRVAPVGLMAKTLEQAFYIGVRSAMLTHGSPEGYLPAGVIAAIIYGLVHGHELSASIVAAQGYLSCYPRADKTMAILKKAVKSKSLKGLGQGWVGHEAMALAIQCALSCDGSFIECVRKAVNIDGDSDSVGAIAGALAGAQYGVKSIPPHMLQDLEHNEFIFLTANMINHKNIVSQE